MLTRAQLWDRFKKYYAEFPTIGLSLDISRMNFPDDFFASVQKPVEKAFAAMKELEAGAIANPDEKRMVGHYWLRNAALAPTPEIRSEIERTLARIKAFAARVHQGSIAGARGPFKKLLVIGIGGSALGPEFVANAPAEVVAQERARLADFERRESGLARQIEQVRALAQQNGSGAPRRGSGGAAGAAAEGAP